MEWDSLPGGVGTGSPYVANGDLGALWGDVEKGAGRSAKSTGAFALYLSKQDFWVSEYPGSYFNHLGGGMIVVNVTEMGENVEGNVSQVLGDALLQTNLTDGNISVIGETWVGEGDFASVYSSLVCSRMDGKSSCDVSVTVRNAETSDLVTRVGGNVSGLFLRKENLHMATNPAWVGSCNPNTLYYNLERSFHISPTFAMANGSCPWVLDVENATSSAITTGSCSELQGSWNWQANETATQGKIEWGSKGLCLSAGPKATLQPCARATVWNYNTTNGFLQDGSNGGCLLVVPDNSNNTLGVGVVVVETESGKIVQSSTQPQLVNASDLSAGITYHLTLQVGTNFTIVTSVKSLRDYFCAGTREETEKCEGRVEEEVMQNAVAMSSQLPSARFSHDEFWKNYWNASSISLGSHPDAMRLEQAWYGFMYSFGSNVRLGKVTPSLYGVLSVMDGEKWNDQLTLDYNLESNYWGAGISNHNYMLPVYAATVTNPALLESVRQRATNPGVWNSPPVTPWPGKVGSVTAMAGCAGSADGTCHVALDLNHTGGYKGAAWPSTAFPLGDGRPAPTDLKTRFVGGLVATPLIQWFEYSRDVLALKTTIYPVVRDNADFYTSYAVSLNSTNVYLPFTCAQEACACRDDTSWYWRWGKVAVPLPNMTVETLQFQASRGGNGLYDTSDGEHNAHIDIAFASQSIRKAIEYSKILGVDEDKVPMWEQVLHQLPPYPQQTLTWVKPNATSVVIGEELSGKPMLIEALPGATPTQEEAIIAAKNSTIVWPTCNIEYPITNLAAIFPTDEIAFFDVDTFSAAKTTAWALNRYTGFTFAGSKFPFSNQNGYGLSWPPVVRVSNQSDAPLLLSYLANASAHDIATNGVRATGGGCQENMAAILAISELLLQSYDGAIHFFPVWDATVSGTVSFNTLRAYGGFLVSAAIDASGTVSPVTIFAETTATPCVVESPWGGEVHVEERGKEVEVWKVAGVRHGVPMEYWAFNSTIGSTFTVSKG